MGRAKFMLASGAMLIALAGCSLGQSCRRAASHAAPHGEEPPPEVERGQQESMVQQLAATLQPPQPPTETGATADYRALSPNTCQCLAAKHAPLADALDEQRQRLVARRDKTRCFREDKSEKQRAFQASMLLYSALEIRDRAAGAALEWYYQIAAAESKADLLALGFERGRTTLQHAEQMKKLGLSLPSPLEVYQRQLLELQLQQAQNQLALEQLNGKLRLALGFGAENAWRIQPDTSVPLGSESVDDVEGAVRLGLSQRPQLLLLRALIADLDRDTLSSSRAFLQTISPLLALSRPGPNCKLLPLLGKLSHVQPGQAGEVERIREQLREFLRERERETEAEIREAAYEVRARRGAVVLAREASERWHDRIRDLEKQRAEGLRGISELNQAHMDWYKARGEVIKEFLGWKIAAVKLKQAQGILPAECGYTDAAPCSECRH
jgi:hypothetical protein